ncbi:DUF3768 domain-containing protein [Sphingobium lactosutens]|uniref:DUF3768 domain-containing protein n=1 Tax=Sphingobium lactosutens DS20 TaxID=1331060 RepID=T0HFZ2_9SPHN|nr:DUF3768 domain-containing protein [Sphingobium lactosutens]EQB11932.1 hypothetical protein RLDS_22660 [Sphingobium lactosutens DS20]MEA3542411.1 DUF3768 domain-containing protein [Pseudomonadota bacterium]
MIDDVERRATIARLNDHLRCTGEDGWILLSAGVAGLPIATKDAVISAIRHFADFNDDNDPHGEHDCALLTVGNIQIIWKIDYYPRDRSAEDADPADPSTIKRVMTIMLGEEY